MGRPIHFEIHATDPHQAADFYGTVFGWQIHQWGEQEYWLVDTGEGDGINGAILPRRGPAPESGSAVNGMVVTTSVEDLDLTLDTATKHGAQIALEPMEIPGVGRVAYLLDPDNNIFGALQPAPEQDAM